MSLFLATPVFADVLVPSPREMLQEDLSILWDESNVGVCVVLALVLFGLALLIWKRKNKYVKILNRCLICILVIVVLRFLWISYLPEIRRAKRSFDIFMCPKDKPLFFDGKCYSCNDPSVNYAVNCEVCSNRRTKYVEMGPPMLLCVLKNSPGPDYVYVRDFGWRKKCPDDNPVMDLETGKCHPCSYENFGYFVWGCSGCPNKVNAGHCIETHIIREVTYE